MATALRRYYRGHNLVTLREVPTAQSRVYHFDHQGTTQCLTDSTGTVTDRFASDAWGVPVKRTGSSLNRHWYVGGRGYVDDRTLLYIRQRYLTPRFANWSSVDPLYLGGRAGFALSEHPPVGSHVMTDVVSYGNPMQGPDRVFGYRWPSLLRQYVGSDFHRSSTSTRDVGVWKPAAIEMRDYLKHVAKIASTSSGDPSFHISTNALSETIRRTIASGPYIYVANAPATYTDPSGLRLELPCPPPLVAAAKAQCAQHCPPGSWAYVRCYITLVPFAWWSSCRPPRGRGGGRKRPTKPKDQGNPLNVQLAMCVANCINDYIINPNTPLPFSLCMAQAAACIAGCLAPKNPTRRSGCPSDAWDLYI